MKTTKLAPDRKSAPALTSVLIRLAVAAPACIAGEEWTTASPRAEVAPQFSREPEGGPGGGATLVIAADGREGLQGSWTRDFPVTGGRWHRFRALGKAENVESPRRSVLVRITWQDAKGQSAGYPKEAHDVETLGPGNRPRPFQEFPREQGVEEHGWTIYEDAYEVPAEAVSAHVELTLRWAPGGSVRWTDVSFTEMEGPPPPRTVRLAAVHFRPRDGKTPMDNCVQFAPLIKKAAAERADLICLPEYVTCTGNQIPPPGAAEPIPGPSTDYFGKLAKEHGVYIVAGLVERDGPLVYNTAALLGPDGDLVGKYRKVCPTDGEIEDGIAPGTEYPVFDTRFGKVGMMICWDVHFPEVARRLSNGGAEIIAMPIAGGNPALARARAIENQVYLLTSTLTDVSRPDWMRSGVFGRDGRLLVAAEEWGTVVVAEVDLRPTRWDNLGNFRDRILRERPAAHASER